MYPTLSRPVMVPRHRTPAYYCSLKFERPHAAFVHSKSTHPAPGQG